MKKFRTLLLSGGGVAAAAVVITLFAPRAAHAIVAALVQVTNTTANPAITQVTAQQASQLVHLQSLISVTVNPTSGCGQDFGACPSMIQIDSHGFYANSGNPYVVPAGENLVITSILFSPNVNNSGNPNWEVQLGPAPGHLSGNYGNWNVAGYFTTELHPTGIVVGPGLTLNTFGVPLTAQSAVEMVVDAFGYLTAN